MSKVSYVDIVPGLESDYWANITPQDRFTHSRVSRKIALLSVKRKKGLTQKSLLPQVAEAWNLLSDAQKTAWSNAGAQCGLNGWRLFVQDKVLRIKNEMAGNATPSLLHQSLVGQLHIGAPATELKITQLHPKYYWTSHKVYGKKGMYEPVLVSEGLILPLKISLNYKSELTSLQESHNFGYEAQGPTEIEAEGLYASKFECPANGFLNSISVFIMGPEEVGAQIAVGIYEDNAGLIGDCLAHSQLWSVPVGYYNWKSFAVYAPLEAGKNYWLALQGSSVEFLSFFFWDDGSANQTRSHRPHTFFDWSDDPPTNYSYSKKISIFATMTENPAFAKLYAEVWSSYQGQDILTDLEIPLDYLVDWKNAEVTLSSILGIPIRYDLFLHLKNLQGDLYVDNIKAEHASQN